LAEEFDIDNVIPLDEQKNAPSQYAKNNETQSFDLSINEYEIESNNGSSRPVGKNFGPSQTLGKQFGSIPGLEGLDHSENEDNGLITSDSDFEQAELAAGYTPQDKDKGFSSNQKQSQNLKRDVSKTFKKMLTSNKNRQNNNNSSVYGDNGLNGSQHGVDST
jgi:hypothetical protein